MIEIPSGTRVYGIQLPIQSKSKTFVADWELSTGPADVARVARPAGRWRSCTPSARRTARRLADTADGVNQIQVRFTARSCEEICDQLTAFATEVAPILVAV